MTVNGTEVTNSGAQAAAATSSSERAPFSLWLQIQSLLNTINHILIALIAVYITALGRSLDFQNTAMHAFLTTIGVCRSPQLQIYCSNFAVIK